MALTDKLTDIADAIRGKTGSTAPLTLDQMAEAIGTIKAEPALQELTITENGEYSPPDGVDGFSKVVANVAGGGAANVVFGEFTPASDESVTIEHGLGKLPEFFAARTLGLKDPAVHSTSFHVLAAQAWVVSQFQISNTDMNVMNGIGGFLQRSNQGGRVYQSMQPTGFTENECRLGFCKGGCTYQWVAGCFE